MLAVVAFAVVRLKSLVAAVMLAGIFSLLAAGVFVMLNAVDVAFTEAAVGAGVITVLLLGTVALTGHREKAPMRARFAPLALVVATGAGLIYGIFEMPGFGDPEAPANLHVAPYYIELAPVETGVPNMVTAVLASYRGYDTLGEVTVIFIAGIGVLLLLGGRREGPGEPR